MKTVKLTTVIALLAAVALFAVSCGGGNSRKQLKGDELEQTTEKMVEQASKGKDFNKAGKAKLASFGKTEKGNRIVATNTWPNDDKVEVFVVVPDGSGRWDEEVYHFFYDTERGRRNYNYKSYADKTDDAGLWILTRLSNSYSSWQEAYDKHKEGGNTIVE